LISNQSEVLRFAQHDKAGRFVSLIPLVHAMDPEPPPSFAQSSIERILPHRYPFLLIDKVTEFVPGQRIAAVKHFSVNDEASQGYTCSATVVPMGIVFETVTQLGAILVLERPEMAGKVAVILQVPFARTLELIRPGDTLRVEAEVVKLRENFGELRGAVYRDGILVAEGQMRFGIANAGDLGLP
jgi:3-hydroxymyristoyl/3-hydroxydecanoyl-(acyl carrier protein) dehydratase